MNRHWNRREFLAAAGTAAAGLSLAPRSTASEPSVPTGMPSTVRVGLIGLDGHYSELLEALQAFPNLRVTALAENSPELLKRATRHQALAKAQVYGDYRELLKREPLQLVVECGRNDLRATVVRACAERRIPIAAEKPLALSLPELDSVKRAVRKNGVPITTLLAMRCYPVYQAMRAMIRSGQIGEVVTMDAQKSYQLGARPDWMKKHRSFGGTIPYIGIHMVDLMRWVSGREFVEAAAFQASIGGPEIGEMENIASVIFRLDNRGTATLRLDYLRPARAGSHGDDRLRIVGTRGILEYREGGDLMLVTDGQPPIKVQPLPPAKSPRVHQASELNAADGGRNRFFWTPALK